MALYHQLKFPSTFIENRSVSERTWVLVISNFNSLEALQINSPRQLPIPPRPKYAPGCGAEAYVSGLHDAAASCKPDT